MSRAIFKMRGSIILPEIVGDVRGNTHSTGNPVHDLGNIDVGPAFANKHCILGLSSSDGSNQALTAFTVGGISFLPFVNAALSGGSPDLNSWILIADISSLVGSQPIIATFSGSTNSSAVSGVSIIGLKSITPVMDTIASTNNDNTLVLFDMEVEEDGFVIAVSGAEDEGSSMSWSSITERVDTNVRNEHQHGAAWDIGFRSLFNETILADGTGRSACGASWR